MTSRTLLVVAIGWVVCVQGMSLPLLNVAAADEISVLSSRGDVNRALLRARDNLLDVLSTENVRSYRVLYAYALTKVGVKDDNPLVRAVINETADACRQEKYRPVPSTNHRNYVAGIEAMLLADTYGVEYQPELTRIRDFLTSTQNQNGSWSYVKGNNSDMSVTQYAILGLWACERAGVDVDPEVWNRAAKFLMIVQTNGGFPYRLSSRTNREMSMTAAGLASLVICREQLKAGRSAGAQRISVNRRSDDGNVRFDILRPVVEEAPVVEPKTQVKARKSLPRTELVDTRDVTRVISMANNWLDDRFEVRNDKPKHLAYWFYTLERAGALAGREKFGGRSWYNACADFLLPLQLADGSWRFDGEVYERGVGTSMIVLFLVRPTLKLTGRSVKASIGGGMLAGGRGLPENLADFGKPVEDEAPLSPLEQLLTDLAEAELGDLPELQTQLVEQIQVTNADELVGQHDLLIRLTEHPQPEVRRTVLWAMGRTGDLRLARYAITALDDQDVTVLTEARNALAWISRRPEAFGHPENPLEGIRPGATIEQKKSAIEHWRAAMIQDWGTWYLRVAPYDGRYNEFELDLRTRLGR